MPRSMSSCAGLVVLLSVWGCNAAQVAPDEPAALARIELPATLAFPEGVAYDPAGGGLYTGSAEDGVIVRVDASSGASDVVAPASTLVPAGTTTFPTVLGMKVDGSGRLWIAGGRTGKIWIVDTADGRVLKDATVPTVGTSLINDVTIADEAGYFTDTFAPTLWRLSARGGSLGDLVPWLDLNGTPIEYGDGPNLNGITSTPDGQTLIVVHMSKGLLFKIDVATRAVTPIDVAGADLTTADGLVLDGATLYVIRQGAQEVVTVRMRPDLSAGTIVSRFSEGLTWPATAAKVGDDLVVVNTQFNTRAENTAVRPFVLLRIPVTRLGPS